MFDAAFTQIRQNAVDNLAVMLRLFRAVRRIAPHLHDPESADHIRRYIDMVHDQAMNSTRHEHDRNALNQQYQSTLDVLGPTQIRLQQQNTAIAE